MGCVCKERLAVVGGDHSKVFASVNFMLAPLQPPQTHHMAGCSPYLITKLCASISGPQPLLSRTPELPTMAQEGNCLPLRGEVRGSSSYRF